MRRICLFQDLLTQSSFADTRDCRLYSYLIFKKKNKLDKKKKHSTLVTSVLSYMCVALIYTSKPCHSFSVACSILLMLILDFHWSRPVWGVIGQCHIWPLRKTLQCSLRDDECIPRGAEKEREPMVRQLTVTEPFVSAPCYHVKHFFSLKCIKYYFLVLFQLKLILCMCL